MTLTSFLTLNVVGEIEMVEDEEDEARSQSEGDNLQIVEVHINICCNDHH